MRLVEVPPARPRQLGSVWADIREGLAWVFGHPLLRPIQLASMCFIAATSVWGTVYLLFLTRQLHLEPWQIGLLLAAGGPGALAGALSAQWVVAAWGMGRPIVFTQIVAAASLFLSSMAGRRFVAWRDLTLQGIGATPLDRSIRDRCGRRAPQPSSWPRGVSAMSSAVSFG